MTDGELETKLRDCVAYSGVAMDVDAFQGAVWDWRYRPVREILGRVHGAQGVATALPRREDSGIG